MQRRDFLKALGSLGFAAGMPGLMLKSAEAQESGDSPVLLTVFARGGWDHSSFWDPRNNPDINHWAQTAAASRHGNLYCAPFGENAAFTQKYYPHMLVFNGLNLQTNGHGAAGITQATGSLSGMPNINALYAAITGADLPMPWLYGGGLTETQGLQPYTGMPSGDQMRQLADPNRRTSTSLYFRSSDMDIIERYRLQRIEQRRQRTDNLPYAQRQLDELYSSRTSRGLMGRLKEELDATPTLDDQDLAGEAHSRINQAHRFLIAAKAGVCVSGSINTALGFDTHSNHDVRHEQSAVHLTRLLDYIWTKAEAMGVADRLLVYVSSDVGRKHYYNGNAGKDHSSTGSALIMMRNQTWTNRVVGLSDANHGKLPIHPQTLQHDPDGVHMMTGHIHLALREILGIADHALCQRYAVDLPAVDTLGNASSPVTV